MFVITDYNEIKLNLILVLYFFLLYTTVNNYYILLSSKCKLIHFSAKFLIWLPFIS